jgi:DNA-binding NarL/FixJ family response regulator
MIHKVILADNQAVFRTGAARIMAVEDDIRIIGQCDDLPRLMKAVASNSGAIVLFAATLNPDIASLVESSRHSNARLIAVIENDESPQHYTRDGIVGVVHRDVPSAELVRCIRCVGKGQTYTTKRSPQAPGRFESDMVSTRVQERLSPKELKILGLILKGYKNKDIAEELNNSEQVIKNYLRSIFDKTGVSDRLELALFTVHHKLLANAALRANAGGVPPGMSMSKH